MAPTLSDKERPVRFVFEYSGNFGSTIKEMNKKLNKKNLSILYEQLNTKFVQ